MERIPTAINDRALAIRTITFNSGGQVDVRSTDERLYLNNPHKQPRPMSIFVPGLAQSILTYKAECALAIDTSKLNILFAYKKNANTCSDMNPFDRASRNRAKCLPPNPTDIFSKMNEIRCRNLSAYPERTSGHYDEEAHWHPGKSKTAWFGNIRETEVIYSHYNRSDILGTVITCSTSLTPCDDSDQPNLISMLKSHQVLMVELNDVSLPILLYNDHNGSIEEIVSLDELGGSEVIPQIMEIAQDLQELCLIQGFSIKVSH